jgi:hypothetical protein
MTRGFPRGLKLKSTISRANLGLTEASIWGERA